MKCRSCEREEMFSVSRDIVVTEYRNVYMTGKDKHKTGGGWNKYKGGGWKVEEKTPTDKMYLRCNACETGVLVENLKDIGEIRIDEKKGVLLVNNRFDLMDEDKFVERRKHSRRKTDKKSIEMSEDKDEDSDGDDFNIEDYVK